MDGSWRFLTEGGHLAFTGFFSFESLPAFAFIPSFGGLFDAQFSDLLPCASKVGSRSFWLLKTIRFRSAKFSVRYCDCCNKWVLLTCLPDCAASEHWLLM